MEIQNVLATWSNNTTYFGGFFSRDEYQQFMEEFMPRLYKVALDINRRRLHQETYRTSYLVGQAVLAFLDYDFMSHWFDVEAL